ncbi:hypothetical protein RYX36_009532 [Vicia faba]
MGDLSSSNYSYVFIPIPNSSKRTAVMIPSFLVPLMGGTDGDKVRVIQILLFCTRS